MKRIVEKARAAAERFDRRRDHETVRPLAAHSMIETKGRISALRLLPKAVAAVYAGSDRNFRRLVSQERATYRRGLAIASSRRAAV